LSKIIAQMYVIFYNNKPIYLTDNKSNCNHLKLFNYNSHIVFELLNKIKNNLLDGFCFKDNNPDELYKKFIKNFKVIEAAGGLVFNETHDLLFIFRNEVWDLPKGKIEKDETIAQAAIREVEEECGITDLQLGDFIDKTYHIYEHKNKFILKITHWFKMYCDNKQKLVPQLEEAITKVVVLNKKSQAEVLNNTYPNIKLLVESI